MAVLNTGDIVVLVSGSPRFAVESMEGTRVHCVWVNEGIVHRDTFDMQLLRKWEAGSDDRGGRGGDRGGDRKSFGGGAKGGDRGGDRGGRGGDRGGDRGPKPFGKKPFDRDKKDKPFYRKD